MRRYIVFSSLAVCFGFVILFFSLRSSAEPFPSLVTHDGKPIARLFSREMIPGSLRYLARMAQDRLDVIFAANDDERQRLYLQYAEARLETAQTMFSRGELMMAKSTIAKGMIYLGKAIALEQQSRLEGKEHTANARQFDTMLRAYQKKLLAMRPAYPDAEKVFFDQQLQYNESLQDIVQSFLSRE